MRRSARTPYLVVAVLGSALAIGMLPVAGAMAQAQGQAPTAIGDETTMTATASPAASLKATPPAKTWWLAAGPAAGGLSLDSNLANYRWDTTPAAVWGLQALVGRGPFATGLRAWRSQTTQGTGLTGDSGDPTVNLASLELVGQARLVKLLGVELWGTAQVGRLNIDYDPDRLTVDPGGTEPPFTVVFEDLNEWTLGLGAEARYRLARKVDLALQVERSSFALDTAHRRGDEIVQQRERFYSWGVRLLVAWAWSLS